MEINTSNSNPPPKKSGYNNLFHLEQILDECLREMECLDNNMASKSEMSIGPDKAYSIK